MVGDILGRFPDLLAGFHDFLARCESLDLDAGDARGGRRGGRGAGAPSLGEKYVTRAVSELDVSAWERCTTSYVRLPPAYPRLACSGRTPLGHAVLNDAWVSVTSGSEDYSFKHMRKNQYEEALFRAEDDRYELDMCIEPGEGAVRVLTPLLAEIEALDPDARAAWRPPAGRVHGTHVRAVARIYGEAGPQVADLLRKNPAVAIPVVLPRLAQKDEEWREVKVEMAPAWARVFDANYSKSLDHRSFYFKQTDKRNLSAKALLAGLREGWEARRGVGGAAAAAAAAAAALAPAAAPAPAPDLVLDFKDVAMHEDVFAIVKAACAEVLSVDGAARALRLWARFVEPLLGLPARPDADLVAAPVAAGDGGPPHTGLGDGDESEARSAGDGEGAGPPASAAAGGGARGGRGGRGSKSSAAPSAAADADDPAAGDSDAAAAGGADGDRERDGGDEEDDGTGAGARPLAPAAAAGAGAGAAAASLTAPPPPLRSFYGSEAFYVLARLHHALYDRLRRAVLCSAALGGGTAAAALAAHAPSDEDDAGPGDDDAAQGGGSGAAPPPPDRPPLPALAGEGAALYSRFKGLVSDLIDGTLDAAAYEDAVRALLGKGKREWRE